MNQPLQHQPPLDQMSLDSFHAYERMWRQHQRQQARAQQMRQQQPNALAPSDQQQYRAPAELCENKQAIRLSVDLPGVYARDLDVSVHQGVLTIVGSRTTMSVDNTHAIKKQKFSRRYALDTDVVDVSRIEANLSQGVLTIRAPKKTDSHHVRVVVTENGSAVGGPQQSQEVHVATDAAPVSPCDGTTNSQASTTTTTQPASSTTTTTTIEQPPPASALDTTSAPPMPVKDDDAEDSSSSSSSGKGDSSSL